MSLINSPDLGLRVQKFLKQQGPIRLGTLEEVLFPTIQVGNLGDETQQQIYGCALVTALSATNGGRTRLCNPANSRVNVHPIVVNLAGNATHYWVFQAETFTGAVGTLGTGIGVNNFGSQSPVGLTGDTPAGVAASIGLYLAGPILSTGSLTFSFPQGLIVTPGTALAMYTNVVNIEQRIGMFWYEETIA